LHLTYCIVLVDKMVSITYDKA